jgi:hypothetical protein
MSDLWGLVSLAERPMNTPKVAKSLHHRLQTPNIEFPLFINETRLRE